MTAFRNRHSARASALALGAFLALGAAGGRHVLSAPRTLAVAAPLGPEVPIATWPARPARPAPLARPGFRYPNVRYDGRFQLVRLQYTSGYEGWYFDYPDMEEHLMTMFEDLTSVKIARKGSNILPMTSDSLFRWPVAYISEPGYWYVSDAEARNLRNYVKKGGFLIIDDFFEGSRQPEWQTFFRSIMYVLPDAKLFPLDINNKIYKDVFFRIKTISNIPYPTPGYEYIKAQFYGIYENNDPRNRLMVVINYNTDLGDYMEHSQKSWWPVNLTNDAYKFAMNYILYGLIY